MSGMLMMSPRLTSSTNLTSVRTNGRCRDAPLHDTVFPTDDGSFARANSEVDKHQRYGKRDYSPDDHIDHGPQYAVVLLVGDTK